MKIKSAYSYRKQLDFIHFDKTRFKVIVAHRRAGKTVASINQLILDAITNPALARGEAPRYAYIAPTYKQAKGLSWDYFKQYIDPYKKVLPEITYNESELKIYLRLKKKQEDPGNQYCAIIKLWGGDDPSSIKGMYLNGCIIDEVAQMHRRLWGEAIVPMLIDKHGWCIFIGTPEGKNIFYELYEKCEKEPHPDWKSWMVKASTSGIIPKSKLVSTRREMTPEEYSQEMECNFDASVLVGAYYAKQIKKLEESGRINKNILHNPYKTVYTAWDLGMKDHTSIWFFQIEENHVKFIDFYESNNKDIAYYVNVLKSKDYVYEYAILPHDGARTAQTDGKNIKDTVTSLGLKNIQAPFGPIYDGIDKCRMLLKRCSFNSETCKIGIEHLKHYRCEYNRKLGITRQHAKHDEHSDACLVGDTKITTRNGLVEIKDIKVGDEVLTPNGYRKVTNHFEYESNDIREITTKDSSIKCTSNHKIFTTTGLFFSDSIRYTDIIPTLKVYNICQNIGRLGKERELGFRDYFLSLKTNKPSSLMDINIKLRENIIKATRYQHYKEQFGHTITEKFQKVITFITKIMTPSIMISPILNVFHLKNIANYMIHQKEEKPAGKVSKKQWNMRKFGTVAKKEKNGIESMQKRWDLAYINVCLKYVIAAVKNIWECIITNIVRLVVKVNSEEKIKLIQRYENARSVKKYLASINTLQHGLVTKNVQLNLQTIQKVYDIEVEEDHCYYANGLLVSNSDAFRYAAVGMPSGMKLGGIRKYKCGVQYNPRFNR